MDPSIIQLNVSISCFDYPNFDFATQLSQRPLLKKLNSLSFSISITGSKLLGSKLASTIIFSPNDRSSNAIKNAFYFI